MRFKPGLQEAQYGRRTRTGDGDDCLTEALPVGNVSWRVVVWVGKFVRFAGNAAFYHQLQERALATLLQNRSEFDQVICHVFPTIERLDSGSLRRVVRI
jgi:hypothetical protein